MHLHSVVGGDFHYPCGVLSLALVTCSMVFVQFHHYVRSLPLKCRKKKTKKLVELFMVFDKNF